MSINPDFVFKTPMYRFDQSDLIQDVPGGPEEPVEIEPLPFPGLILPGPSTPEDRDSFETIEHKWFGTDGSEWDLSHPPSGVFLMQEAIEGMHMPTMDMVRRESPMIAGSSFHGYRVLERKVVWPLYVYSDVGSNHFAELDRALWKSLKPGREGVWRVTLPNGDFRELRMRISAPTGAHIYDRDPVRFGWQRYAVEAVADVNPFWSHPLERAGSRVAWAVASENPEDNFFGGADGVAPPFIITESAVERIKEWENPGDEDVWPTITVTGPMQKVVIKQGDDFEFTINCNLTDSSKWLRITTDPRFYGVTDQDGNNRIRDVSTWSFKPLPADSTTRLEVTPFGDGGGTVIFDAPPLYYRAW